MKNVKIKLRNSFHGTSCVVVLPEIYATEPGCDPWRFIEFNAAHGNPRAKRQFTRVKRILCGCTDCKCGTVR